MFYNCSGRFNLKQRFVWLSILLIIIVAAYIVTTPMFTKTWNQEYEHKHSDKIRLLSEANYHGAKYARRIFYNRVLKCGSRTLLTLMSQLSHINNFTYHDIDIHPRYRLSPSEQKQLGNFIEEISTPMVFARHVHFVDFSRYGMEQPLYINIVRDPLERLVSMYYFHRYNWKNNLTFTQQIRTYDECVFYNITECIEPNRGIWRFGYFQIIPFFCGHQLFCGQADDNRALETAKENVKRHYAVVGLTEEYDRFITVLEHIFPDYFKGISKRYRAMAAEMKSEFKTRNKLPVSKEVSLIMHKKLKQEYEFYNFLKERFHRQAEAIQLLYQANI